MMVLELMQGDLSGYSRWETEPVRRRLRVLGAVLVEPVLPVRSK